MTKWRDCFVKKKIEVAEKLVGGSEVIHFMDVEVKEKPPEDCSEGL